MIYSTYFIFQYCFFCLKYLCSSYSALWDACYSVYLSFKMVLFLQVNLCSLGGTFILPVMCNRGRSEILVFYLLEKLKVSRGHTL